MYICLSPQLGCKNSTLFVFLSPMNLVQCHGYSRSQINNCQTQSDKSLVNLKMHLQRKYGSITHIMRTNIFYYNVTFDVGLTYNLGGKGNVAVYQIIRKITATYLTEKCFVVSSKCTNHST